MTGKRKSFKVLILSLIAALLIFIPAMAVPQTAEAATGTVSDTAAKNALKKVKVVPEYRQTLARSMLPVLNSWRAGRNWYYNKNNTKLYVSGLKALKYDYTLEQYAMQRAAEVIVSFDHVRPKGDKKSGLSGYSCVGENLAVTKNQKGSTVDYAMTLFKEEDKNYSGQGHRRMMLSVPAAFDAVGMACVYYKGCYYWVQEFGVTTKPHTTSTKAVNGNKTMTVEIKTSDIKSKSTDLTKMNNWRANLVKGEKVYLPDIGLNIGMAETWPGPTAYTIAIPAWTSSNSNVVTINSGTGIITAVGEGTATITMKEPITGTTRSKTVTVTDPNYTGLRYNKADNTWYYYSNGKKDANFSGVSSSTAEPKGKFPVKNGKWDKTYTGLAYSKADATWYYFTSGKYDTKFSGLSISTSNSKKIFYVSGGKWQKTYTGKITYNKKTYNIKAGKVV